MDKGTALLVVDMQTELLSRKVCRKESLLDNVNRLLDHFHRESAPVFLIRHGNDSFLQPETGGWQLYKGLRTAPTDTVFDKSRSSAFKEKAFLSLFRDRGVDGVAVAGLVSQGCVRAACEDAAGLGFSVTLIGDAHSTFTKDAEKTIAQWNERLGAQGMTVTTTEAFIAGN